MGWEGQESSQAFDLHESVVAHVLREGRVTGFDAGRLGWQPTALHHGALFCLALSFRNAVTPHEWSHYVLKADNISRYTANFKS
jgi:hypothetical protein